MWKIPEIEDGCFLYIFLCFVMAAAIFHPTKQTSPLLHIVLMDEYAIWHSRILLQLSNPQLTMLKIIELVFQLETKIALTGSL